MLSLTVYSAKQITSPLPTFGISNSPAPRPAGLALGLSVSVALQVFALFECWSRKNDNTDKKQVYLFFLKIVLISLLMGVLLYFSVSMLRGIFPYHSFKGALIISFITGIEFILLLLALGRLFKIRELTMLFEKIIRRGL